MSIRETFSREELLMIQNLIGFFDTRTQEKERYYLHCSKTAKMAYEIFLRNAGKENDLVIRRMALLVRLAWIEAEHPKLFHIIEVETEYSMLPEDKRSKQNILEFWAEHSRDCSVCKKSEWEIRKERRIIPLRPYPFPPRPYPDPIRRPYPDPIRTPWPIPRRIPRPDRPDRSEWRAR